MESDLINVRSRNDMLRFWVRRAVDLDLQLLVQLPMAILVPTLFNAVVVNILMHASLLVLCDDSDLHGGVRTVVFFGGSSCFVSFIFGVRT